jgi:thiosulfate dehydrogenase [quinone] large subunit
MAKSIPQQSYRVWSWLRVVLGIEFLWAFLDKLFGLGFSTCRAEDGAINVLCDKAWLEGGSPTFGFLKFGTNPDGPLYNFYQGLASPNANSFVNWLFMIGLLAIGVGLLFGVAIKLATASGILMLMLMWSAVIPPENNPFLDDHIISALALFGIMITANHQQLGFGKWWKKQPIVEQYPFLV